jgi:UDP-glucuronate decarboxylase
MATADEITGPVNLGNPNEFTVLELAELVIEVIGSKSKIVFEKLPSDDPRQRQPDISLARKLLGWEPKVELRDGLEPTIEYFDKLLKSTDK